jgi:hypothetical protein
MGSVLSEAQSGLRDLRTEVEAGLLHRFAAI